MGIPMKVERILAAEVAHKTDLTLARILRARIKDSIRMMGISAITIIGIVTMIMGTPISARAAPSDPRERRKM